MSASQCACALMHQAYSEATRSRYENFRVDLGPAVLAHDDGLGRLPVLAVDDARRGLFERLVEFELLCASFVAARVDATEEDVKRAHVGVAGKHITWQHSP